MLLLIVGLLLNGGFAPGSAFVDGIKKETTERTVTSERRESPVVSYGDQRRKPEATFECPKRCFCNRVPKSRLYSIDCGSRKLSDVPAIPEDTKTLNLNDNRLHIIITDQFHNLAELTDLNLSNNKIKTIEKNAFRGLFKLKVLSLSSNLLNLPGCLPGDIFKPLTNLSELFVDQNCNSETACLLLVDAITNATSVETLYLDGYRAMQLASSFRNLHKLTTIRIGGSDHGCNIDSLSSQTFASLADTPIIKIDISRCNISHVEPGSFSVLKQLSHLDVSGNGELCHDGWRNLTTGLQFTSIRILDLDYNCVRFVGDNHTISGTELGPLFNTSLVDLKLDHCKIQRIDPRVVTDALPRTLQRLHLNNNDINRAGVLIFMPLLENLQYLDVSSQNRYSSVHNGNRRIGSKHDEVNGFGKVQGTIHGAGKVSEVQMYKVEHKSINSTPTIVKLPPGFEQTASLADAFLNRYEHKHMVDYFLYFQKSRMDNNNNNHRNFYASGCALDLPTLRLPWRLKFLNASNLNLEYDIPNITFDTNNSLEIVDGSRCLFRVTCGKVGGLHRLKWLNFSGNKLRFLSYDTFADMPRLEDLNLSDNEFGEIFERNASDGLFRNLANLKRLNLELTKIKKLPKLIFTNLRSLQELRLGHNSLEVIQFSVEAFSKTLHLLDLSHNSIVFLSSEMTRPLEHSFVISNLTLLLYQNNFRCDCDHILFTKWIAITKIHIPDYRNMTCKAENETNIKLHNLRLIQSYMDVDCVTWLVVTVCVSSFIVLTTILSLTISLYRQRWKLRYLYYASIKRTHPYAILDDQNDTTDDVYLSFDEDHVFRDGTRLYDLILVRINNALQKEGLKVNFRERLFAGKSLNALISTAVQQSNKTVVFLSCGYCDDFWNVFEFNMAAYEGMYTNRKVVVPVLIGEVDTSDLLPDVKTYLQNEVVIRYNEDNFDGFIEQLCHMILN